MEPRCRRRDRTAFARKNSLIPLPILRAIRTPDVRRQGDMPQALDGGVDVPLGKESDGALAAFVNRNNSAARVSSNVIFSPTRSFLPGRTNARHSVASPETGSSAA